MSYMLHVPDIRNVSMSYMYMYAIYALCNVIYVRHVHVPKIHIVWHHTCLCTCNAHSLRSCTYMYMYVIYAMFDAIQKHLSQIRKVWRHTKASTSDTQYLKWPIMTYALISFWGNFERDRAGRVVAGEKCFCIFVVLTAFCNGTPQINLTAWNGRLELNNTCLIGKDNPNSTA